MGVGRTSTGSPDDQSGLTGSAAGHMLVPGLVGGDWGEAMLGWIKTCHPDIRLMLQYWQDKCAGRPMPARSDIDPNEIRRFLPYITLVDVVDDGRRFVYRLVGTKEVALRGRDPTGKSIAEAYFGRSVEDVMAKYDGVCVTRAPFHEHDDFQVVDRYVGEENLFLPLSDDGAVVNKIMVFSINRDLYDVPLE